MSTATDLVLKVFELVDGHELEEMGALLTSDVDFINPLGHLTGRDAVIAKFVPVKAGFPDSRHIMEGVYDAGGAVALEGEWTGTNSGPLATPDGEVTTGKTVRFPFGAICQVDGVKTVHIYHDLVIMSQQMGLMASPGAGAPNCG